MRVTPVYVCAVVIVVKDLSCLGRTKSLSNTVIVCRIDDLGRFVTRDQCAHSHPRGGIDPIISSRSRHSDFEGKRRIFADNARVWKPLKNQHFSAIGGKNPRKARCTKEFEKNSILGRKTPVGENLGRTRGEKHSNLQITPTLYRD